MNKDYSDYNLQKNILIDYLQIIILKEDWQNCTKNMHGYNRDRGKY
jgi:hypothetical protein